MLFCDGFKNSVIISMIKKASLPENKLNNYGHVYWIGSSPTYFCKFVPNN